MNDHYGNEISHYGDSSACARSVYQALSPPPLEGPGNETSLDGDIISSIIIIIILILLIYYYSEFDEN